MAEISISERLRRSLPARLRVGQLQISWKHPNLWLVVGLLLSGVAAAYLIAIGNWHIALALAISPLALMVLHRYPYLAVIGWLVLSPFLVQTPSEVERQIYWLVHRLLPLFTIGLVLISSALHIRTRELPRLGWPEFAMLGYVIASVLSIFLQNNDPFSTLYRFYDRVFVPMSLYWVIRLTAPGPSLLKWLLPVAIYLTVTQVSIGILSWVRPSMLPSEWLGYAGARTTGSLNSVSVYTTTLVFSGLMVLHTALKLRSGWQRKALILIFLSTLYAIFISYSRASWLVGALVLAGLLLIYPRFMVRLGLFLLPAGLLLGGVLLSSQIKTAEQRLSSSQTALSRLPVLVAAYRMFEARPILGWGYANFDRYDRRFQGRFGDVVNPDEKDLTSHNMYMTLLAEQGLIGFGLFVSPLVWLGIRSLKAWRRLPSRGWVSRQMLYLLWLVVMSFVVVNNFAPMVVVFGLGLYWLTLGLIASMVYSHRVSS